MPPSRAELALEVADLVGETLTIEDTADGWPALGHIRVQGALIPVAIFVARVGRSHRGRDDTERRFQNPSANARQRSAVQWQGRPLVMPPDRIALLVGLWTDDDLIEVTNPVLVLADAGKRHGLTTRHSIFVQLEALEAAATHGLAESINVDGETMLCCTPEHLPGLVEAATVNLELPSGEVRIAVDAVGMTQIPAPDLSVERERRMVSSIVRDARFSRQVIAAYGGRCAMCGLELGLVQAAHIYPASMPGSSDEIWNGLCLCSNHHLAFDRHLLWVDPASRSVSLSPEVLDQRDASPAAAAFISFTFATLAEPDEAQARPAAEMFDARYAGFDGRYDWAGQ